MKIQEIDCNSEGLLYQSMNDFFTSGLMEGKDGDHVVKRSAEDITTVLTLGLQIIMTLLTATSGNPGTFLLAVLPSIVILVVILVVCLLFLIGAIFGL